MPERREVNTARPEHSWIPFYRELAKKLADPKEGWRDRQGEIVDLVREMARDENLGVPRKVADCEDPYIDPFSLFACFNNDSKGENRLLTIQRIGEFFDLRSKVLHHDYDVPDVFSRAGILYWIGKSGYQSDVEKHWDTFEFIMNVDSFDAMTNIETDKLIQLMNASLSVNGIRITKLSSAFYWINPFNFIERKTINGIVHSEIIKENDDASTYLEGLTRAREVTDQPFPELNNEVYSRDGKLAQNSNVWVVRGGNKEAAVNDFLSEGRTGIDFNMGSVNLSDLTTVNEMKKEYRNCNIDPPDGEVNTNSAQIRQFILEMKVGDYVLMPEGDRVHYGVITSRPYRDPSVSYANSRKIEWNQYPIPSSQLPNHIDRKTVSKASDQVKSRFCSWLDRSPEDSWVLFHLEVGQKLIQGEWQKKEKRDELVNLIQRLRQADPEGTTETNVTFDPFNLYQAFCQRHSGNDRMDCFKILKEVLDLESELPDSSTWIRWNINSRYRVDKVLDEDTLNAVWELLRVAVKMDPANDESCRSDFINAYNAIHNARPLSHNDWAVRWARTLSRWLHLIAPTKFVTVYKLERLGLLSDLGLDDMAADANGDYGKGYVQALVKVNELAKQAGLTLLDVSRKSTTREMLYPMPVVLPPKPDPYTIKDMQREGVFLECKDLECMQRLLRSNKNLILQGSPGVGKTFIARKLAYLLMGSKSDERITPVQFHQSYSYEDFVQGYRPTTNAQDEMKFEMQQGAFFKLCVDSKRNPSAKYVMIIDEINRGNLSRIFGELLSLIENDKRDDNSYAVELMSGERFTVPNNVYIIGMMNLADRSLTGMDYAMRRRFKFVTLEPQFGKTLFLDWLRGRDVPQDIIKRINDRMSALNEEIRKDPSLGRNFVVGHSYFCDIPEDAEDDWSEDDWKQWYREIVKAEIQPLLEEYWFDNQAKADGEVEKLLEGLP